MGAKHCFGRARKINLVDLKKKVVKIFEFFLKIRPPPLEKILDPPLGEGNEFSNDGACIVVRINPPLRWSASDFLRKCNTNSVLDNSVLRIFQRHFMNTSLDFSQVSYHNLLAVFLCFHVS